MGREYFPLCPVAPDWQVAWEQLEGRFSWIREMDGVPQNPVYHAEGNVSIHTRMVTEALVSLEEWRNLPREEQVTLFAAALLHDAGKPACTHIELNGHISSRGHARKGEKIARRVLWTGEELEGPAPFAFREAVAGLVRWHGLPLQWIHRTNPERAILEASMSARLDHVALLAEADVRGRICPDAAGLLERIDLFRIYCQELECYKAPRTFSSDLSRFVYFHSEQGNLHYEPHDDTTFEVILMAGLPGAGKDTWIREQGTGGPVISLDGLRKELGISAEDEQGRVVQAAKERARKLMRAHQSFIWNATNVTMMLREQLVEMVVAYGGRVRIVYIDAPFADILRRNRVRPQPVPEAVIYKLLGKLEMPDPTEAHRVEWIATNLHRRKTLRFF